MSNKSNLYLNCKLTIAHFSATSEDYAIVGKPSGPAPSSTTAALPAGMIM
jgi:hypothetical protein